MSLLRRAQSNNSTATAPSVDSAHEDYSAIAELDPAIRSGSTPSEQLSQEDSNSSLSIKPLKKTTSKSSVASAVGSLVAKLPSSATNKLKRTYKRLLEPIYNSPSCALTDGPVTKHFDEPVRSSSLPTDDDDMIDINTLSLPPDENNLSSVPEVPEVLITGLPLMRVTRKKRVQRLFKIDLEKAIVSWKTHKFMSLDRIVQIRVGDDAKNYREEYGVSKEQSNLWATIIYNDQDSFKLKVLHIIAPTRQDFELFINTITDLVSRRRNLMKYLSIPGENFAKIHWKNYISNHDQSSPSLLSFDDIQKLTKRLHINCNERMLYELFRENDKDKKDALNFEEFQKFVKRLKQRPEIVEIFKRVTEDNEHMTKEQFRQFMEEEQFQFESDATINKWFNKFSKGEDFLTIDTFTNYLTSYLLSPLKPTKEDLSRPLNEYYISSSHNTYLIGKQFGNSTSIEGYIKVLQRGCRCIEIDIWDGDTGPVVRHGKLTGFIQVSDVFEVVRKYAFIITPFPLVLSLEVHCKPEYQYRVKEMLLDIFQDVLVTEPLIPDQTRLPSPEDLKHRVLVKVKRTPDDNGSILSSQSSSSFTGTSVCEDTSTGEDVSRTKKFSKATRKQFKVVPELSDLGVYTQGLRFRNFSLPESKTVNHVFSFSEGSFNTMMKDPEKEYLLKKHNRNYLMRVYPSGYRYNSTNFTPLRYWNYGAQMVATNWQTFDIGQQINEAMFNCGDRNGYVLKPQNLRNISNLVKFKDLHNPAPKTIKFRIEVISGQLLPRPKELKPEDDLSPCVIFDLIEAELIGPMKITDTIRNLMTHSSTGVSLTRPVYHNGFNPVWNYRFEGKFKSYNGLDLVRFMVKTGEVVFAIYCSKLTNLKQGYIHIPLFDLKGEEYIFSTLFINVKHEEIQD